MTKKIGVLIGSLRKDAWTRKIANQFIKLAPSNLNLQIIDIGNLPLYNEDLETGTPPASWDEFRDQIRSMDGMLLISPEYNRSMSGALKNAIDVGSRPYGKSAWNNKAIAVVSSSPGAIGGFGANHHIRQSFACLNAPIMPSEIYLSGVNKLFNEKHDLADPKTEEFLRGFLQSYASWVETNGAAN
jgi:chromate reductase, NAD(P)H dehydrogenase (quinone)